MYGWAGRGVEGVRVNGLIKRKVFDLRKPFF